MVSYSLRWGLGTRLLWRVEGGLGSRLYIALQYNYPLSNAMSFLQTPVPALPLEISLLRCVKHEHPLDLVFAEILQTVWYAVRYLVIKVLTTWTTFPLPMNLPSIVRVEYFIIM